MYTFLLVILIIDALLLVGVVLMQAGKGGGMAASFGGQGSSADSIIGTRQAGNVLTKASWWLGGTFLVLAFVLQLMSSRSRVPESVLDRPFSTAPAAPAPTGAPAVPLEAAPAVPLEPAPTQGTPPAATPPGGQTQPTPGPTP